MANNESFQGVSSCYVFKSRLQEYAQKAGLLTPVYETIKEGPSHEPTFRSTVIVNNVRYDSLHGFFNRKAAEQSAAEVALMKLLDSGTMNRGLSQPVHETGLCKNLLQEYAQKMNFAIPQYECQRSETSFSCTVEIGGMRYIGGEAKTKKEAEIKAARTALLDIQSSGLGSNDKLNDYSVYTVIPLKKNVTDLGISNQESAAALKPKKARFKKRKRNGSDASNQVPTKNAGDLKVKMVNQAEPALHENAAVSTQDASNQVPKKNAGDLEIKMVNQAEPALHESAAVSTQDASNQIPTKNAGDLEVKMVNQAEPALHENVAVGTQDTESGPAPAAVTMDALVPCHNLGSDEHKTALMVNQNDYETLNLGINSQGGGGGMTEVNAVTAVGL